MLRTVREGGKLMDDYRLSGRMMGRRSNWALDCYVQRGTGEAERQARPAAG